MVDKRRIEIFSPGCPACEETIQMVNAVACPACDVRVLDMQQADAAAKAKEYGVKTVPAVVIDGKLSNCCTGRGVDEATLRANGVGVSLS